MVIENREVRETLIDVIREVRGYGATLSTDSLKRKLNIIPSKFIQIRPYISLTKFINNPNKVQCLQYGGKKISPVQGYVCIGCPFLEVSKCLAGQIVYLEKHEDSREEGRHLRSGHNTAPRRPPSR